MNIRIPLQKHISQHWKRMFTVHIVAAALMYSMKALLWNIKVFMPHGGELQSYSSCKLPSLMKYLKLVLQSCLTFWTSTTSRSASFSRSTKRDGEYYILVWTSTFQYIYLILFCIERLWFSVTRREFLQCFQRFCSFWNARWIPQFLYV